MQVRVIQAGKYDWGKVEVASLKDVAEHCNQESIIGEFLGIKSDYKGGLHLQRPSHRLINFHVEGETLVADLVPLKTAYGLHLTAVLRQSPEKISYDPVFSYDDSKDTIDILKFITVNAILTKDTI